MCSAFRSDLEAQELDAIRDLRNALGHGHSFTQDFIPRLRRTIKWIDQLSNLPQL